MTATAPPAQHRAPEQPAQAGERRVAWQRCQRWLLDWWPFVLLAVAAFAIRWPNLWYIPQFTDEVFDAQVSYGIWEGKRPLIGVNAYTGAFYYYLLAGVFWLFGPSIYAPRLFVLVLGVCTVLATALLAAELGRRAAGDGAAPTSVRGAGWIGALVGGGLLATSGVHVLTNSHLSWPHSTLPLYLTLAFWLIERAVNLRPRGVALSTPQGRAPSPMSPAPSGRPALRVGGWALVGAGLLFGLAQQHHPTMLLLWPVLLGYVGWRGRAYFRTRWAYGALLAFLVGISPLIFYNLVASDFGSLKESLEQTDGYQDGRDKDFSYRGRALEIVQTMPRIAASAFEHRPSPVADYLRSPITWVYTLLGVAGLVAAARLGTWSLPLAVVAFLLLLPLFPASHDNLPRQGRYLMPLFPFIFAGIGGLAVLLWQWAAAVSPPARAAVMAMVAAVLAVVVCYPLIPLGRYELSVLAANETNDRYYVTLGALERQRRPGEPVVLDPTLQGDRTGAAGTAQRTFDFMMELRGIQRAMLKESSERIERELDTPTAVVLADQRPSSLRNRTNADAWTLEPLENDDGGGFTLWRITRR